MEKAIHLLSPSLFLATSWWKDPAEPNSAVCYIIYRKCKYAGENFKAFSHRDTFQRGCQRGKRLRLLAPESLGKCHNRARCPSLPTTYQTVYPKVVKSSPKAHGDVCRFIYIDAAQPLAMKASRPLKHFASVSSPSGFS